MNPMTRLDHYKTIAYSRRGRVLTLTLNRPDSLNAVNEQLHTELSTIFTDAADDPGSDIIVLTGAGRAFCAGGDLAWLQAAIDQPSRFERIAHEAKRIVFSQLECAKPIIAKVNGHAMGLGASIALFCDVIFAADTARIADPHVSIGLTAGDGGCVIWPQLIGYARAKEFLMTGDPLTAQAAAQIGLINRALPAGELDAQVDAFADRLAGGALLAIRTTKASINIGLKQLAHSIMDACLAYETVSNVSEDHREAVAAFREKRKAVFRGC